MPTLVGRFALTLHGKGHQDNSLHLVPEARNGRTDTRKPQGPI